MRFFPMIAGAIVLATPAVAQEPSPTTREAQQLARSFGDPARQEELARSLETLSDVLLDMPLAPIAGSLAEATGQDPQAIDPDLTLRQMAPGASAVPGTIREQLPRAMDRAAQMSAALVRLGPAFAQMARQFEDALPPAAAR